MSRTVLEEGTNCVIAVVQSPISRLFALITVFVILPSFSYPRKKD